MDGEDGSKQGRLAMMTNGGEDGHTDDDCGKMSAGTATSKQQSTRGNDYADNTTATGKDD
jgi:hypothetical protein